MCVLGPWHTYPETNYCLVAMTAHAESIYFLRISAFTRKIAGVCKDPNRPLIFFYQGPLHTSEWLKLISKYWYGASLRMEPKFPQVIWSGAKGRLACRVKQSEPAQTSIVVNYSTKPVPYIVLWFLAQFTGKRHCRGAIVRKACILEAQPTSKCI